MALGTIITNVDGLYPKCQFASAPQLSTPWTTVIDAGGMDETDNATARILNPITSIVGSNRHKISLPPWARYLFARLAYTGTPSADPVIQIFGFDGQGDTDKFVQLQNMAGTPAEEVTLTTATASDITDGTDKFTEVLQTTHKFDLLGSRVILVGVKTAYAVSAGSAATAYLQIRATNF